MLLFAFTRFSTLVFLNFAVLIPMMSLDICSRLAAQGQPNGIANGTMSLSRPQQSTNEGAKGLDDVDSLKGSSDYRIQAGSRDLTETFQSQKISHI